MAPIRALLSKIQKVDSFLGEKTINNKITENIKRETGMKHRPSLITVLVKASDAGSLECLICFPVEKSEKCA